MVLGIVLYRKMSHLLLRKKLKNRFQLARVGEKSAQDLLQGYGYQIELTQKNATKAMWVNDKPFSYIIRPDAFARKEGKLYLVEIKTGKIACDPKHIPTRRQLLEYFYSFDVEGVILVDAEIGEIHQVRFMEKREPSEKMVTIYQPSKLTLAFTFITGMAVALLLVYFNGGNRQ